VEAFIVKDVNKEKNKTREQTAQRQTTFGSTKASKLKLSSTTCSKKTGIIPAKFLSCFSQPSKHYNHITKMHLKLVS